jgi:hypothetical protein
MIRYSEFGIGNAGEAWALPAFFRETEIWRYYQALLGEAAAFQA